VNFDPDRDPDAFHKWLSHPETQKAFAGVRRKLYISAGKDPDRAEMAFRRHYGKKG
jgi:hypothetical protein